MRKILILKCQKKKSWRLQNKWIRSMQKEMEKKNKTCKKSSGVGRGQRNKKRSFGIACTKR